MAIDGSLNSNLTPSKLAHTAPTASQHFPMPDDLKAICDINTYNNVYVNLYTADGGNCVTFHADDTSPPFDTFNCLIRLFLPGMLKGLSRTADPTIYMHLSRK